MRIFLTFASEQNDIAESIQLALRNRGHQVFFSHDDLPPGESFDERIQKSIGECELLVFLISPQSVAKGRYTLTELAFARSQWRSPRGRVLPVVVAPTPMESIPNYLKAVTLLEPEGNIAAETAAAVDRVRDPTRTRNVVLRRREHIAERVKNLISRCFDASLRDDGRSIRNRCANTPRSKSPSGRSLPQKVPPCRLVAVPNEADPLRTNAPLPSPERNLSKSPC